MVDRTDAERRSSWLKGVLDLLVLAVLDQGESYGYQIAKALDTAGFGRIKGGTLYPVLNRLEEAGLLAAEFRASARGPGRRYYTITSEGRAMLSEQAGLWRDFADNVHDVLEPRGSRETR